MRRSKNTSALEAMPNVGPATAEDLHRLGIFEPANLVGKDPDALYEALCEKTGVRHDPCARDVFAAIVHHAEGGEPRPWWIESRLRKAKEGRR